MTGAHINWRCSHRCTFTRNFNTSQLEVMEMERVCFVVTCKVFLWNHCENQSAGGCPVKHVIFVVDTRAFCYQTGRFWRWRLCSHFVQLFSTMSFRLWGSFHSEALACEPIKRLRQFVESSCQRFCWMPCYVAKQIDWWTESAWYGFQLQGVCFVYARKKAVT